MFTRNEKNPSVRTVNGKVIMLNSGLININRRVRIKPAKMIVPKPPAIVTPSSSKGRRKRAIE